MEQTCNLLSYVSFPQRRHALRSYSQALQVYKGKAWTLAEDHINFTIGRQSLNLKQLDNAASAFRHLLIQESKQTPVQQNAFLREYLFVYKQLISQMAGDGNTMVNGSYPQLPLPSVDGNDTKVLVSGLDPDRTQGKNSSKDIFLCIDNNNNNM
jgi:hypothetical protein